MHAITPSMFKVRIPTLHFFIALSEEVKVDNALASTDCEDIIGTLGSEKVPGSFCEHATRFG